MIVDWLTAEPVSGIGLVPEIGLMTKCASSESLPMTALIQGVGVRDTLDAKFSVEVEWFCKTHPDVYRTFSDRFDVDGIRNYSIRSDALGIGLVASFDFLLFQTITLDRRWETN